MLYETGLAPFDVPLLKPGAYAKASDKVTIDPPGAKLIQPPIQQESCQKALYASYERTQKALARADQYKALYEQAVRAATGEAPAIDGAKSSLLSAIPTWVWVAAGGIALYVFLGKK